MQNKNPGNAPNRIYLKWLPTVYLCTAAIMMLGYVRFDPYQVDGDAVSYMDLASSIVHGRWHEIVNGLWNPGYPALLALGKLLTHADRFHELPVFYWVNYFIFLGSMGCTWYFVRSLLGVRRECSTNTDSRQWAFQPAFLYLVGYAIVLLSWQNEFSMGKIRVDGFFASLLMLAFAFLFRAVFTPRLIYDVGLGLSLGLAYLVKSPGFVLAIATFLLLAIYTAVASEAKYSRRRLLLSFVIFALVAGPYIALLSSQKGRADFGDSGNLNYAWYVSGTGAQHLLNNQPARFGNATVNLKHSETELASDPIVLYFTHFPNATYGPWFDPSYFNEGIRPRINFREQWQLSLQQSRQFLRFIVDHALLIALLILCFACGMMLFPASPVRWIVSIIYLILLFSLIMYLCVHFLDRYVAGQFWIALIVTFAFLLPRKPEHRHLAEGASAFLAIAILVLGVQAVMHQRETAIMQGTGHGWYQPDEFHAASALRANDILPGDTVACFRACNTGTYWARLAGLHVTSEIYDLRYMSDAPTGAEMWQDLPNKEQTLRTLKSTGAKALIGYFESPPFQGSRWHHLAGGYYFIPLS